MRVYFISLLVIACRNEIKTPAITEDTASTVLLDSDGDGYYQDEDCDDSDSSTYPDAPEICDGVDNNCNQEVDEGVTVTVYVDADGDGFGDSSQEMQACAASDGLVPNANDCNDLDATVFPSAPEVCDDQDNDCDGDIDEEILGTWYRDFDDDGYGTVDDVIEGCKEEGYVDVAGDCDDANDLISPAIIEECDEVDNNCDGEIDEGLLTIVYLDADEDGFGDDANMLEVCTIEPGMATVGGDCDDINAAINPDAIEVCDDDDLDEDCDGVADGSDAVGAVTWYRDSDNDTYGDPQDVLWHCDLQVGYVLNNLDCGPTNSAQYPGATEYCNGTDDDCDGVADTDEVNAVGSMSYYPDSDSDGYGANNNVINACQQPNGMVSNNLDCLDSDPTVYLGAAEICDGQVNSCGNVLSTSEVDDDGDGYVECSIDTGGWDGPTSVVGDGDCDDSDATIHPFAPELCDGQVNACGGTLSGDESDDDGDGYVECSVTTPWSGIMGGDDCDDSDASISPGAVELCDGIPNLCGSSLSPTETDNDGDGYVECSVTTPWSGIVGGDDCDDSSSNTAPNIAYLEDDPTQCMTDGDGDGFGDLYASVGVVGTDCDDTDATLNPDLGTCSEGLSCKDILDNGGSQGSGVYLIDPDGPYGGVDPFEVYCDMTTDGGGWTEISYASDLPFQRHFFSGDGWYWLPNDFQFELTDTEISAIQSISNDGKQEYVGLCEHVIHHYYNHGGNYAYAFGFELFDGSTLGGGNAMSAYSFVSVTQDGCAGNGGENGNLSQATIFSFNTPSVPIVNVRCRDCGDGGEYFGSPLTANSAWLR